MPGLKVWLDIDQLIDISNLEESISDSVVFGIYYSSGYFRSEICRRELYTAIRLEKPIVIIYYGDHGKLNDVIAEECIRYCRDNDSPGPPLILEKMFGDTHSDFTTSVLNQDPIQWLDRGGFSAASLNIIYRRLLSNLPYYKNNPTELSSKGITVPGKLEFMPMHTPINVLVCDNNYGCLEIAEELKGNISGKDPDSFCIIDAAEYLVKNQEKEELSRRNEGEDEDGKSSLITQPTTPNRPTFLLLYLNEYTFGGNENHQNIEMEMIIESCLKDPNIHVVLVHEQDALKGGCKFDYFFSATPEKLIDGPDNLYQGMAIPLYTTVEYRDVSLKMILNKMVAACNPKLAQPSISNIVNDI